MMRRASFSVIFTFSSLKASMSSSSSMAPDLSSSMNSKHSRSSRFWSRVKRGRIGRPRFLGGERTRGRRSAVASHASSAGVPRVPRARLRQHRAQRRGSLTSARLDAGAGRDRRFTCKWTPFGGTRESYTLANARPGGAACLRIRMEPPQPANRRAHAAPPEPLRHLKRQHVIV